MITIDAGEVQRFRALFDGLPRAYGTYSIESQDERGKRTGSAITRRAPVTDALVSAHLAGDQGIGIVPIRDDATARFGAIDIDVYDGLQPAAIAATLLQAGLPLVTCQSKSGGVHIFCFTKVPVPAFQMRVKLQEVASLLGHGGCEIFPKQSKILAEECGGWINLPFCGETRLAVRPDGETMSLQQFLDFAEGSRVPASFFGQPLHTALADGPPCLGHLIQIGIPPGTRNATLFQLAIYAKRANPDGWTTAVEGYNRGCFPEPLGSDEVLTVIKSVGKKDYHYSCDKAPLAPHCNRALCKTRRYGIGDSGETFPVLGTLVKFESVPPRYVWEVDGQRVQLATDEILSYAQFARACFERINKILPDLKPKEWKQIVGKALEHLQIEAVEDASPEAQFWELLGRFCTRNPCDSLEEITMGRPYTANGKTYFRLSDLLAFLAMHRFRDLSMQEAAAIMKQRGAVGDFKRLRGQGVNMWVVPEFERATAPYPLPPGLDGGGSPF